MILFHTFNKNTFRLLTHRSRKPTNKQNAGAPALSSSAAAASLQHLPSENSVLFNKKKKKMTEAYHTDVSYMNK